MNKVNIELSLNALLMSLVPGSPATWNKYLVHKRRLLEEEGKCPGYETHLSSVSAVQEEVHSL